MPNTTYASFLAQSQAMEHQDEWMEKLKIIKNEYLNRYPTRAQFGRFFQSVPLLQNIAPAHQNICDKIDEIVAKAQCLQGKTENVRALYVIFALANYLLTRRNSKEFADIFNSFFSDMFDVQYRNNFNDVTTRLENMLKQKLKLYGESTNNMSANMAALTGEFAMVQGRGPSRRSFAAPQDSPLQYF